MAGPNSPYTSLDADQVIKQVFNPQSDKLRVEAEISTTITSSQISAEDSNIGIKDKETNTLLKVNPDGSIDTNVVVSASGGDNIAISDGSNTLAVKTDGSIKVVMGSASVPIDYDQGQVQYNSPTVETYLYKKAGNVIKTVVITYTDASKENISGWTIS